METSNSSARICRNVDLPAAMLPSSVIFRTPAQVPYTHNTTHDTTRIHTTLVSEITEPQCRLRNVAGRVTYTQCDGTRFVAKSHTHRGGRCATQRHRVKHCLRATLENNATRGACLGRKDRAPYTRNTQSMCVHMHTGDAAVAACVAIGGSKARSHTEHDTSQTKKKKHHRNRKRALS